MLSSRIRLARSMHALAVPYVHNPVVQLKQGVPVKQVRQLTEEETRWDFWTSSDAFRRDMPESFGFTFVPFGEVWVTKSGKVLNAGLNWITPFSKIQAVKTPGPISMGIISNDVALGNGQSVNAYAVVHVQVNNFAQVFLACLPCSLLFIAIQRLISSTLKVLLPVSSAGLLSSISQNTQLQPENWHRLPSKSSN